MLKQLEVDALRADLDAVSSLLATRRPEQDPVGYRQFSAKKKRIEDQLAQVVTRPQHNASVGLFFGGNPVIGSRGIIADFGMKAIEQFQNVVSTRFASLEGPIGSRGPTKQRNQTQMLLTDVVRGSFGFILEEISDKPDGSDILKEVVSEVVDIIYRASDQSMEVFDEVADAVDDRVLHSIQAFFKVLDDNGATLRMVEDTRDFLIDKDDISRARKRVDNISIQESIKDLRGILYATPSSKKFELIMQGGTVLKGSMSPEVFQSLQPLEGPFGADILATWCNVEVQIREVTLRGQTPRYSHRLLKVLASGGKTPDA